jgi:hypothetical protein
MLEFLRPIVIFDTWLYIILGIIAVFFLRLMWLAHRDRSRSIFSLERENASVRLTRAFAGFMIVLVVMLGVYYLSLITPTIVPPPPATATPTPIIALPPTPTPPPLLPTPTPTATPAPTLVPTQAVVEEASPTPTSDLSRGVPPACPNPAARITRPGDGAVVIGLVQVQGAAAIENFDYYKFEFQDPVSGEWVFIARYDNSVPEGVLGSWNSDTVPPGSYQFRLVVVDKTGNFPEPCQINLQVQ